MSFTCPKCRECGCDCGTLPYTVEVTLSGVDPIYQNPTCSIEFRSCFGSGVSAVVSSPGGCGSNLEGSSCPPMCGDKQNDSGQVASVSLTSGGSCYAKIARLPPDISLKALPSGLGGEYEQASFKATLGVEQSELCGSEMDGESVLIPHWTLAGADVDGGKGYAGGEKVVVSVNWNDVIVYHAAAKVVAADGVPTGIEVTQPGHYYKEDLESPGYASPVLGLVPCEVVTNEQTGFPMFLSRPTDTGSAGGAVIRGVVETDAKSEKFGQVVDLKIDNAGDHALGWTPVRRCDHLLNGVPITLAATESRPLVSFEPDACYGAGACAVATPVDERFEPELKVYGTGNCTQGFSIGGAFSVFAGCGASITFEVGSKLEDGDPTRPVWFITSLEASGGIKYSSVFPGLSFAKFYNGDLITNTTDFPSTGWCSLKGALPVAHFDHEDGVLTGAHIDNPGAYYAERKYLGEPVPIQRVSLAAAGGGYAKLGRVEPTLSLETDPERGGVGVTLTPTLGTSKDECGVDYWFISKVEVSGGTGYLPGPISVAALDGAVVGEAASIRLTVDDGVPADAVVQRGGKYWKESKDAQPYVATAVARVLQLPPSQGEGAVVEFEIDDDPNSETFGTVVDVKIVDGGKNYILSGQAGCTYGGRCGFEVVMDRRQISLEGPAPSATSLESLMVSEGLGENCSTGEVIATPARGWNQGATANIKWPSTSGGDCGSVECSPPCPTGNLLCTVFEVETPFGNTITKSSKDFVAPPDQISAMQITITDANEETGGFFEVSVVVQCGGEGNISVLAFCVYFDNAGENGCFCTSGSGCSMKWCTPGNWWDGEYVIPIRLDGIENQACSCCCPDPVATVRVTISTPAEIGPPC